MTRLTLPSPSVRRELIARVGQIRATRPRAWQRRQALSGLLAFAWLTTALVTFGIRHDWPELAWHSRALTLGGLLTVAGLASVVGLTRGRSMLGAATASLTWAVWGLLILLHALVLAIDPRGPSTVMNAGPRAAIAHTLECFSRTIAIGAPLVILGIVVVSGLILGRPGLTGSCIGLGAATFAHGAVWLQCPIGGSRHALLGHLLPAIPLMIAGAWAVRMLDRRFGGAIGRGGA